MHFIQAECANCGAHLVLDDSKNTAVCPSCGTPYIISNAVSSKENNDSDFVIADGELLEYKGKSEVVSIPKGISTIGEGAFLGTAVQIISLPDTVVRIKDYAFKDCQNLSRIRIPASVVDIEASAFQGNKNLNIIWPDSWKNKHLRKLHIAAHAENLESLVCVPELERHYGTVMYYYLGRNISGNYMFCQCELFKAMHTKKSSVFDDFEIASLDIVQMFNELTHLYDRAGIPRNIIGTAEVPYYGNKTKIINRGNARRGMVQVLETPLSDED